MLPNVSNTFVVRISLLDSDLSLHYQYASGHMCATYLLLRAKCQNICHCHRASVRGVLEGKKSHVLGHLQPIGCSAQNIVPIWITNLHKHTTNVISQHSSPQHISILQSNHEKLLTDSSFHFCEFYWLLGNNGLFK